MNNAKHTRRALLSSVVALVICLTMLMGTTFAWFTDTATVSVNTITSGTLEIALVDKDGKTLPDKLEFIKADGAAEGEEILWEPGCTYELPAVYIKNLGNLAIKYEVVVTGIEGDAELLDVIEWTIDYGYGNATKGHLAVGEALSAPITIKGHMKEEAGNDYQGKSITGIAINVYATQDTVEYDSTTNQYDKNATVDKYVKLPEGTTQDEINDAIAGTNEPTVVELPKGEFTLPTLNNKELTVAGGKDTVIDTVTSKPSTNGADLTFKGVTVNFKAGGQYDSNGFTHSKKVVYEDCVINGTQFLYASEGTDFINCTFNVTGDAYNVWTYGTNATFTGCTFNCEGKAVLIYTEGAVTNTVTFNDCKFIDNNGVTEDDGSNLKKAAIEVGESAYGNKANYTININRCNVEGFDTTKQNASTFGGTDLGTSVWGNKNLMPADRLNVFVNGTEVY